MTMRIVLASNNTGKLHELGALFQPLGIELIPQGQLLQGEAPEPFHTFVENALSKARFAAEHTGLPSIADDAGLCVDAFGGLPGVQTAFYATQFGYPKDDWHNVQALLEQLKPHSNRHASMVSTLVGVRHPQDPQPLIAVGRVQVQIAPERKGDKGFGFDPVLWLPELQQTFAELPEDVKNRYSHRGRAAATMRELVREHWLPSHR